MSIATTNDGRFVLICSAEEMNQLYHLLDDHMREETHVDVSGLLFRLRRLLEQQAAPDLTLPVPSRFERSHALVDHFVWTGGHVGALTVASVVLFLSVSIRKRLMPYLLSYAAGALLATALGGILPEALALASAQAISVQSVLFGVLGGLLLFFALEGLVIWRHEYGHDVGSPRDTSQRSPSPVLIVVGDACHNFVDGVVITTSVLASPALGLATTLAVVGHEIQQEVGDFVLLLHSGLSRGKR